MKILVVEDNIKLLKSIVDELNNHFETESCSDGEEALYMIEQNIYDLIVLDLMLPNLSGIEILKSMRDKFIDIPVLILTAKESLNDKVKAFEIGANDYLTKPFATDELLARIRALGRRSNTEIVSADRITCGDVSLDCASYELICGKSSVKLGLKEFSVMELLMKNNGPEDYFKALFMAIVLIIISNIIAVSALNKKSL